LQLRITLNIYYSEPLLIICVSDLLPIEFYFLEFKISKIKVALENYGKDLDGRRNLQYRNTEKRDMGNL